MIEWIVSSSVLIVFIAVIRFLFRNRLSLRVRYALWLLVAVRLLIPVSLWESSFSVLNLLEIVTKQEEPFWRTENDRNDGQENPVEPTVAGQAEHAGEWLDVGVSADGDFSAAGLVSSKAEVQNDEGTGSIFISNSNVGGIGLMRKIRGEGGISNAPGISELLFRIWLAGAALCIIVVVVGNSNYRRRLYRSRKRYRPHMESALLVYISPVVSVPCLFGLAHPAIYLNPGAEGERKALSYVLSHENTHYRHHDNLWALVRTICVCVHWYNPLVWLASGLSRQDCELACDEEVLGRLGEKERIEYGRALLAFSARENMALGSLQAAITLSGGKKQLKERLMIIVRSPKRNRGALVWTLILALLVSTVTFTGKMDVQASEEALKGDGGASGTEDDDIDFEGENSDEENLPQNEGRMEYYVKKVPFDLGEGGDYELRISGGTIPGTGKYQTSQVDLCMVRDGEEIVLQTIRAEDTKVLNTKSMSAEEQLRDGDFGGQWSFSPEDVPLFAKPLRTLEDLPGQATNAFLDGSSGELWAYAPDGGILVADLNFDGYNDICLQAGVGSVNVPYYCWLWNSGTRRFEHSYMIPNVQVNEEMMLLESVTKDEDGVYAIKYYRFDELNSLHLVRYVEENQSQDAVFPVLDLTYCEDGYYILPAVDDWDYGTEYGGALTERLIYWAKQALMELYEWSGTKIDTAAFSATEFGSFYFGNSPADVAASRTFYDRSYGSRAGFRDCIESMYVVTERTVWYSDVIQWNVPDNLRNMTNLQVVEWYFGRSALAKGEKAVDIEEVYDDTFVIRAESGRYYEITLNLSTREVSSIYGPYDSYPMH